MRRPRDALAQRLRAAQVMAQLWPLVVFVLAVVALVAAIVGLSYNLGERHFERATGQPYESGIRVRGSARKHVSVEFYRVAMLFVIFDLEAAFLVTWAVAARTLGWSGYFEVVTFSAVLLVTLAYAWRMGALSLSNPPNVDSQEISA